MATDGQKSLVQLELFKVQHLFLTLILLYVWFFRSLQCFPKFTPI